MTLKKLKIRYAVISALIIVLAGGGFGYSYITKKPSSICAGRQWKDPDEQLDCLYPFPPTGRWKAVYTQEFAKKYALPSENISTDMSPGVDYMEMDVQQYTTNSSKACLVNMLVRKPHDIALYSFDRNPAYDKNRKLSHLLELNVKHADLKSIASFSSASRDYMTDKRGFRASTYASVAEDVLPGYDFFSANANCRDVSLHPQYYPDGYAFWISKASVWGRYDMLHRNLDAPDTPKGMEFERSHFFINIPGELITVIFKDVPIGGR